MDQNGINSGKLLAASWIKIKAAWHSISKQTITRGATISSAAGSRKTAA